MTTKAAAEMYKAMHIAENENKDTVIFNPYSKPVNGLPVIYAFSNVIGGGDGQALAMAEDGLCLGEHWCSAEAYVPHDLGVLVGTRDDRHETYRAHYPDGYRMEFVPARDMKSHPGIAIAYELYQKLAASQMSQND